MHTLECPECKQAISHERPHIAQRMFARHRTVMHGVLSQTQQKARERLARIGVPRVYKTKPEDLAKAKQRYWAKKGQVAPVASITTTVDRDTLQKTSWWQTEGNNNKPITCPCCSAQFIIVSGSK